jgi:uncharacterized protein YdhG (YjbR/CyaY superfamily)
MKQNDPNALPIKTIDDYLFSLPENMMLALEDLRSKIHNYVPDTEEVIHYQIPTFRYKGRALVGFAVFKKHCSFFVMSRGNFLDQFKKELEDYKHAGATIHFQIDKPLPEPLIQAILKVRMLENEALEKKKLEKIFKKIN